MMASKSFCVANINFILILYCMRVWQNEIMDEKTLPVVPSSWEEGFGVVENNNDITYYKLNI